MVLTSTTILTAAKKLTLTLSGVPQGTCLPLLFIFINDLPYSLPAGCSCRIYADGTKIFTVNDCQNHQSAMDAVAVWSRAYLLDISTDKTAAMRLGRTDPDVLFTFEGATLNCVEEKRNVIYDSSL